MLTAVVYKMNDILSLKKTMLLVITIVFTLNTFVVFSQKQTSKRPNVVIIFMDDMGYGDPACYNGLLYQTPNIDRLAAEGMRFTNFYAAQAVCSASRAALLTGCYPNRIGISGALPPWSKIALNPQEETIASMLKKTGYHTGMIGKWHLGMNATIFNSENKAIVKRSFNPARDYWWPVPQTQLDLNRNLTQNDNY
jgi:arylsulfatase